MSKENGVDLTRRKALLGIGTVGVAGAGAALGTSAYFSDEELFEDNSLEAGELDLYVHYEFSADQDGVEGDNFGEPTSGTIQGDTDEENGDAIGYSLADVKPGDNGGLEFCFSIVDNPAYLWMGGELTANDENGYTEPEPDTADDGDANDPGDGDGEGELADVIEATLCYYEDGAMGDEIVDGSLRDVLDALESGVALDGGGNGEAEPGEQEPFDGGADSEEPTDETCVYLDWGVPTDVGNEIQTDIVEFDLSFYAEQSRHNDGTDNPYGEEENGDEEPDGPQIVEVDTDDDDAVVVFDSYALAVEADQDLSGWSLEGSVSDNGSSSTVSVSPPDGSSTSSIGFDPTSGSVDLVDDDGNVVDTWEP